MKEKFEQFADYFRKGNVAVYNINERYGEVVVDFALGSTRAVVRYDGVMVSIVHYIVPIREKPSDLYYRVNNLDSKFNSIAKIGLNVERFNGQEYLYTAFAFMGNGNNGYEDADLFFEKYQNAYDIIESDINYLINYL